MSFYLWLENQELKDAIRDQLASAMQMQGQKENFGALPLDSLRASVLKALKASDGWMRDKIPDKEKWLGAEKWVQMAHGKTMQDLIEYLAGEQSADPVVPTKQLKATMPQAPATPQMPNAPQMPIPQSMPPQPSMQTRT